MNAIQLIDNLQSLGVALIPNGERLQLSAPLGVITPELRDQVAANKTYIMAVLANSLEQKAINELIENPSLKRSITYDDKSDPVKVHLAIRDSHGISTVTLLVDADKWDPFRVVALLAESNGSSEVKH